MGARRRSGVSMLELSLYFVMMAIIVAVGATSSHSDQNRQSEILQQNIILVDVALAHWYSAHGCYPEKLRWLSANGYLPLTGQVADTSIFTYMLEDKGNAYTLSTQLPDKTIYYSPYSRRRRR